METKSVPDYGGTNIDKRTTKKGEVNRQTARSLHNAEPGQLRASCHTLLTHTYTIANGEWEVSASLAQSLITNWTCPRQLVPIRTYPLRLIEPTYWYG